GSDAPDLASYFRAKPYANPACNSVDQRLAGEREMRLYVNGNVALAETTQGLASYYHRHSLSFFTDVPPQATTMSYALDTDTVGLTLALTKMFPGVDLSDEAAVMAMDPVLYNQVVAFAANWVLRPMIDFVKAHSDGGITVTNLLVIPNLERPGGMAVGGPGMTLAGLSISPALLSQFAMTMPDEAQIWQNVDVPAGFTPIMVLGNNVLQQARVLDPTLDDIVTAHEFGHSGALIHSMVPRNLMYPSASPGIDDCTDGLDDAQLSLMAATLGVGVSASTGALLARGSAATPAGASSGRSFAPDRLRALLAGDGPAMRSFVERLFHPQGAAF
ncbi:MAG TPA: hypothetical protein VN903_16415, partial [Polyangia bacterium]|nr:hypothetical protein [Polyangia bacterium]